MMLLDLDELPEVFDGIPGWSARRPALAWFRRRDHLGDPDRPLADEVRRVVAERTGAVPQGPVRTLTHLRYLGHCFNPVSFHYCYAPDEERLEAVVAHVTNTPWGDSHPYVLVPRDPGAETLSGRVAKRLHVSPFMGMQQAYEWRLRAPGERLFAQIASFEGGSRVFEATLTMQRRPLSAAALRRLLLRHPAMTMQVTGAIYHEALRLRRRGAGYHRRPAVSA